MTVRTYFLTRKVDMDDLYDRLSILADEADSAVQGIPEQDRSELHSSTDEPHSIRQTKIRPGRETAGTSAPPLKRLK